MNWIVDFKEIAKDKKLSLNPKDYLFKVDLLALTPEERKRYIKELENYIKELDKKHKEKIKRIKMWAKMKEKKHNEQMRKLKENLRILKFRLKKLELKEKLKW